MLSKNDVNTGRQTEADFAKFICLIGMIIVHCFDAYAFFSDSSTTVQYVFLFILNCIFGAGTFMFCMGLGLAYTSNNAPGQIIKRGIKILIIGYVLNIVCALGHLIVLKDMAMFISYLICPDILQFAGLALIVFGILKKFVGSDTIIGVIAIILSVISTIIGTFDLKNIAANIGCGLFLGAFDFEWYIGGVFPLFNWFIFVVAGYLFAKYVLRRCENKDRLYLYCLIICGVIIAIYMAVAIPNKLGMMGYELLYYHIRIHEALVVIAGALLALSIYHFVLHIIPGKIQNVIVRVSRSINIIYCCQWVIIVYVADLWKINGQRNLSDWVIILTGLIIFVLCAVLAELFSKLKNSRCSAAK